MPDLAKLSCVYLRTRSNEKYENYDGVGVGFGIVTPLYKARATHEC